MQPAFNESCVKFGRGPLKFGLAHGITMKTLEVFPIPAGSRHISTKLLPRPSSRPDALPSPYLAAASLSARRAAHPSLPPHATTSLLTRPCARARIPSSPCGACSRHIPAAPSARGVFERSLRRLPSLSRPLPSVPPAANLPGPAPRHLEETEEAPSAAAPFLPGCNSYLEDALVRTRDEPTAAPCPLKLETKMQTPGSLT